MQINPVQDFVNGLLAAQKPFAHIECHDDPRTPGRRVYTIGGSTPAAVQTEINKQMAVVEILGGRGEFLNPITWRDAVSRYGAQGFIEAPYVSLGYTQVAA